jgi:hypothetical protein
MPIRSAQDGYRRLGRAGGQQQEQNGLEKASHLRFLICDLRFVVGFSITNHKSQIINYL